MNFSAEQFTTITDYLPMPLLLVSARGTILSANKEASIRLGLNPAAALGRSLQELTAEDAERISEYLRFCTRTRASLPGSLTIRGAGACAAPFACQGALLEPSKNGQPAVVLLRLYPKETAVAKFRALNRKIDEMRSELWRQRRAEANLRRHNERLRILGEIASEILNADQIGPMTASVTALIKRHFELDLHLNYLVNPAGDGLVLESSSGLPAEITARIARLKIGDGLCGRVALQREPLILCRDHESAGDMVSPGTLGFRAYAGFPMIAGGQLIGTFSFGLRHRERFEEEELEFYRTVVDYTTVACERIRLIQELREDSRRKDQFLAILAHELRNPLAPLRNGLEVLKLAPDDNPRIETARAMMERQLQRLVRLIDDLLDICRINTGKLPIRKAHVELSAIIGNAVEAVRPQIDGQLQEFTLLLPPQPIYVEADSTRLTQMFSNLLDNSSKYTEKGGRIWLTAEPQSDAVKVTVRDNGVGVAPEHLHRIFDVFSQAAPALERSQGGLGIGLSLVKSIVELHGGTVEAKSPGQGGGSEFIVCLPIAKPGEVSLPKSAEQPKNAGKYRILLVDDNRDVADSTAMMLEMMGHDIIKAYDGLEAVQTAPVYRPDVVLLDIGLPKMNGYDTARYIRNQPRGQQMIVIALTGWGQEEDRRRALEAGCDYHLTKPVDPTAMEELFLMLHREN